MSATSSSIISLNILCFIIPVLCFRDELCIHSIALFGLPFIISYPFWFLALLYLFCLLFLNPIFCYCSLLLFFFLLFDLLFGLISSQMSLRKRFTFFPFQPTKGSSWTAPQGSNSLLPSPALRHGFLQMCCVRVNLHQPQLSGNWRGPGKLSLWADHPPSQCSKQNHMEIISQLKKNSLPVWAICFGKLSSIVLDLLLGGSFQHFPISLFDLHWMLAALSYIFMRGYGVMFLFLIFFYVRAICNRKGMQHFLY